METITKTIKYKGETYEFTFVNEFIETRNGFKHHTDLYFENELVNSKTMYYIGRTWECYEFQKSMYNAVLNEKNAQLEINKTFFKRLKGYKKLTTSRQLEFEKYLNEETNLNILDLLLESLN